MTRILNSTFPCDPNILAKCGKKSSNNMHALLKAWSCYILSCLKLVILLLHMLSVRVQACTSILLSFIWIAILSPTHVIFIEHVLCARYTYLTRAVHKIPLPSRSLQSRRLKKQKISKVGEHMGCYITLSLGENYTDAKHKEFGVSLAGTVSMLWEPLQSMAFGVLAHCGHGLT